MEGKQASPPGQTPLPRPVVDVVPDFDTLALPASLAFDQLAAMTRQKGTRSARMQAQTSMKSADGMYGNAIALLLSGEVSELRKHNREWEDSDNEGSTRCVGC